jgi:hypothetical protein
MNPNPTPKTETTETTETPKSNDTPVEPVVEEENKIASELPEFGEEQIADFLKEDDDSIEEIEVDAEGKEKTVEAKTPSKEPAVAVVPEGETLPVVELKKEPEVKPVETPAPEQAAPVTPTEPEPVVAAVPVLTAEEQTKAYEDWREEIENDLATNRYAINDDEASEMDISPEAAKAYSKGLSRVYMDAVTGAIGHMTKAMPQLLETALTTRETTGQAEKDFYTAWPKLNNPEYVPVIQRLGVAYRQLNPSVSKEDFIRDVGAQAHIALRLPVEEVAPVVPASVVTPIAPVQPFKPAGSGAPGGGSKGPINPFEALNDSFDVEEEEIEL